MPYQLIEYNDPKIKSEFCLRILRDLPEWFGLPELNKYRESVKKYRFIAVLSNNSEIGCVSIKKNSEKVTEIHLFALKKVEQHKGIGTKLLKHIEEDCIKKGVEYLEVKTLDESEESEAYNQTRMFYSNNGFIKFDVLFNEWGENNPCLIMIKHLSKNWKQPAAR